MYIFFYVTIVLLLAYGILIEYYRRAWNSIPPLVPVSPATQTTTVTIIIPARNEEENIGPCLEAILQQTYPRELVEVLVIDDHSTDATATVVMQFSHRGVRLVRLQDHIPDRINSYKKKAIEIGIAQSAGDWIITTDADCTMSPRWISSLVQVYEESRASLVAAPVRIMQKKSLLSIFQTLDFISLQGITGASVYRRIHTMCNGANLGYERKAFEAVGGFEGIDSIASGDDMLLMYKIHQKYPDRIFFLKSRDAIVNTAPVAGWKAFVNQRIRWASKADKYDDKRIFATLLFVYVLNACILASLFIAIWNWHYLIFFGLLVVGKTLLEYPLVYTVAEFFGQQSLMVYFFFLQPLHIFYTVIAGWLGKFGSYQWKGRIVK